MSVLNSGIKNIWQNHWSYLGHRELCIYHQSVTSTRLPNETLLSHRSQKKTAIVELDKFIYTIVQEKFDVKNISSKVPLDKN